MSSSEASYRTYVYALYGMCCRPVGPSVGHCWKRGTRCGSEICGDIRAFYLIIVDVGSTMVHVPPRSLPARRRTPSAALMGDASAEGGMCVPYRIGPSAIAGEGIFATAPIKRGQLLWRYVVGVSVLEHNEASLRSRLAGMAAADVVDLLEHIYVWNGLAIEILDDAKIWNHAAHPNTGNHPDEASGEGDGVSSYALRDIEVGEELTDDYATFGDVPWYETICTEHGAHSCLSVGRTYRDE